MPGHPPPLRLFYFAPPDSIHTQRWLSAFVDLGHEVHLATPDVEAARTLPGVIVHDIGVEETASRLSRFIQRWRKVRRILATVRPHVLHGHPASGRGAYAAYFPGYPLVMTAWGSDVLVVPRKSWRSWLGAWWRLRRCDLVTADSVDLKRAVCAFGVPEDRVALVQWGVDVARFRALDDRGYLRQLAGVPPDVFVVLSTRNLEPVYGLDTLIRAIPRVVAHAPRNVCFVLAGGGSLRTQLERLAEDLGVAQHVRFVGSLPHPTLERCYVGADAYVSVSVSDSTSVSLLEALAAGLPAVVTDVPSNLEWVRDGWNGYVVARGDSDAVADALLRLVADEDTRRELGAHGPQLVWERGDHHQNMRRMESLYRTLASGGTGGPDPHIQPIIRSADLATPARHSEPRPEQLDGGRR